MAQKRTQTVRRLARRYGLRARGGVALACVLMILLLGGVGAFGVMQTTSFTIDTQDEPKEVMQNDVAEAETEAEATTTTVVVHVDGAVVAPGVYVLEGTSLRVNDAIDMAQGLLKDADTTTMNLAAPIEDGQKIHVPTEGEVAQAEVSAASSQASPQQQSMVNATSGRINVNTATVEELQELPGVGEATASAIVEDRQSNGPFASPEDLMRISGIGEKKLQKMRGMIDV